MVGYLVCVLVVASSLYGAQETTSPFSYYIGSDKKIPYLGDGCYTILTEKGQKVLTGPHLTNPLITLWNKDKTLVACKNKGSRIESLRNAHRFFIASNRAHIKAFLYTHAFDYDDNTDEHGVPLRKLHEGRAQDEEMVHIEKQLTQSLQLVAHTDHAEIAHINSYTVNAQMRHHTEPATALTAPLFVVVEHTSTGPRLFNVCPIAARLFDIPALDHPYFQTDEHKIELLKEKLLHLRCHDNPYYKALKDHESYGSSDFVEVVHH